MACYQWVPWEQGRSIGFCRKQIALNKLTKRGQLDGLSEVLLTDSTLRWGKPTTWGSGQQKLNFSKETCAPFNGRIWSLIQSKGETSHDNGIRENSS